MPPDFNAPIWRGTPHLARDIENPLSDVIGARPFGVIRLDPAGGVMICNRTEARLSGYKSRPALGRRFFTNVALCMNTAHFKGRIEAARRAGTLNITFSFTGDFADPGRDIDIRVRAAADAGLRIFTRRDPTTGSSQ